MRREIKRGLLIGGAALLGVVALVGWTRKTTIAPPGPNYFVPPAQAGAAPSEPGADMVPANPDGTPVVSGTSPFGSSEAVPVAQRQRATRAVRSTRAASARPRYLVKKRKFSHSAAIVGGSAAGGAAVGALAGGGKGAAIGALAGGGAGLVYDRLTHKKRVRVE